MSSFTPAACTTNRNWSASVFMSPLAVKVPTVCGPLSSIVHLLLLERQPLLGQLRVLFPHGLEGHAVFLDVVLHLILFGQPIQLVAGVVHRLTRLRGMMAQLLEDARALGDERLDGVD